ncbi:unnamed protein product [Penicillium roqueforti FM164]|uniref:Uncharacterized protein n=1 Tax=Penicillium roqueforti (strain FM164) TaxID=1365484 RepID=W6R545_PENRF|nr:unnamed protein product [Penicillium roqueforti FM164]
MTISHGHSESKGVSTAPETCPTATQPACNPVTNNVAGSYFQRYLVLFQKWP